MSYQDRLKCIKPVRLKRGTYFEVGYMISEFDSLLVLLEICADDRLVQRGTQVRRKGADR